MDREPLLPPHLDYLTLRNQRPTSIRARRLAIMRINGQLGGPVADASRADIEAWQLTLPAFSPGYQHNQIVHLSQYLHWTIRAGHRDDDPTVVIVRPRNVHQQLPRPMSDADVGMALLTAPHPERAWIALGAFCGLRCCEIAGMMRDWIRDDRTPATLDVIGKGAKRRVVPLPDRVLHELYEARIPRRGYCWTRMDGQPGPPSAVRVSERINAHLHEQGINGTAHALRHRFGTVLYRETKDALLVAQVMGHASVDTVRGYILVDPFDAAAPIELISRLANE